MKTVVVTGASGFLGQAVCAALKTLEDIELIAVTRGQHPNMLIVDSYWDAPEGDVLIHLAEISDRGAANRAGKAYFEKSISTLQHLLGKGYSQIIYASSSVLYGDKSSVPCKEGHPVAQTDVYSEIKLASEELVISTNGAVARLANLYGPLMAKTNVLSDLAAQLNGNAGIELRNLFPIRDFIWIEDAAEAFVSMVVQNAKGVFNIGSGIGVSIKALAENVLQIVGQQERVLVSKTIDPPPSYLVLDITHAATSLGWKPRTELVDGLRVLFNTQY